MTLLVFHLGSGPYLTLCGEDRSLLCCTDSLDFFTQVSAGKILPDAIRACSACDLNVVRGRPANDTAALPAPAAPGGAA